MLNVNNVNNVLNVKSEEKNMVKVVNVKYGDWSENFVCLMEMEEFSEKCVRDIVSKCEIEDMRGDYVEGEEVLSDEEIRDGVKFVDGLDSDVMIGKESSVCDEFGEDYFNYELVKNKVVRKCDGKIVDESEIEVSEWVCGCVNGEIVEELDGKVLVSECDKYIKFLE